MLRALGASPAALMADGLLGMPPAVAAGSLLAAAVAVGLSPFSLFGPVREVDPGPGIGVPLGIAAGRWLWLAFAHQLSAVPDLAVPATAISLAAVTALLIANLVAAVPGIQAARTPAALLLRAE